MMLHCASALFFLCSFSPVQQKERTKQLLQFENTTTDSGASIYKHNVYCACMIHISHI